MNRRLEFIDSQKWYHLESLKKFYDNRILEEGEMTDADNISFKTVKFRKGWSRAEFIVNPKTKRLKYLTPATLAEIGFKFG